MNKPFAVRLENVSHRFLQSNGTTMIADNQTFEFPAGQATALIGANGAGKTTLLRLISGALRPNSGRIIRNGAVSWPIGFAGTFQQNLTAAQNCRFTARAYGADTVDLEQKVADIANLGVHFHEPVRDYSSGMRARLAFALSMSLPFDTYLIDEVTAVGDADFRKFSHDLLMDRIQKSTAIIVNHDRHQLDKICTSAVVLANGHLRGFDTVKEAFRYTDTTAKA